MSPRSKRDALWDLEDSEEEDEVEEQEEDMCFPETCLCLVCGAELGSPEEAKEHIDKFNHNNLEMVNSIKGFAEEFDHSFYMYQSF